VGYRLFSPLSPQISTAHEAINQRQEYGWFDNASFATLSKDRYLRMKGTEAYICLRL
jgi:hypothetical protein